MVPESWIDVHSSCSNAVASRPGAARLTLRWVFQHLALVAGILSAIIYGSIWVAYFLFYGAFHVSPSEVGLGGVGALSTVGVGVILLFFVFFFVLGGIMLFQAAVMVIVAALPFR